jgi:hypothetical protein
LQTYNSEPFVNIIMNISIIFSTLVLRMSTVAIMATSATHLLGKVQDQSSNVQRVLNVGDIKNRLVFEQAMSGSGGSIGGMTTSAWARTVHQQQQTGETIQAKIMAHPPRDLQTTRSMSFEEFCSTVTVCICSEA